MEIIQPIYDDPARIMAEFNVKDAIGYRGFISPRPEINLNSLIAAMENGYMHWGQRIYIVKDLDEARRHHEDLTIINGCFNKMLASFYLVSNLSQTELAALAKGSKQEILEVFVREYQNGIYYLRDNEWVRIPEQYRDKFMDPILLEVNPQEGYFFYQTGWFAPEVRGVIRFHNLHQSKTINNIRKISRNLFRRGYRVCFNQNLLAVIKGCKEQERKGQSVSSSRITESFIKTYKDLEQLGKAYSAELIDPEGNVIAGTFGFRSGSVFGNESIFYPTVHPGLDPTNSASEYKSHLDYAKAPFLALIDRLEQGGLQLLDVAMVTSFTENSFKAEYISRDEFLEIFHSTPKDLKIDFETEWNPMEEK